MAVRFKVLPLVLVLTEPPLIKAAIVLVIVFLEPAPAPATLKLLLAGLLALEPAPAKLIAIILVFDAVAFSSTLPDVVATELLITELRL